MSRRIARNKRLSSTLLWLGCASLAACSAESDTVPPCCAEDPGMAAALPGTSVFQLESVWRDQGGAERRLVDLRGHVTVAAMIFTNCSYACPQLLADLQSIEQALAPEVRAEVRFALVSMDSARDTPDVLATYARERSLDLERWTLLHGDADSVRDLAAVLGIKFKQQPNGDFAHSNVITVLDRDGQIAHQQTGLNAPTAPTAHEVTRLVRQNR